MRKINICKLNSKRTGQAGFSLVELMVVVAIIGVLATLAIPNINKFIAKARQSEARANLSSLYTSEKAFFSEFNAYHAMFGAIGFEPAGQLRYNLGFAADTPSEDAGVANGFGSTPTVAPGNTFNTKTYCGGLGQVTNGCTSLRGVDNVVVPNLATTNAVVKSTTKTFIAAAESVIFKPGKVDTWTINQDKFMSQTIDGLQ